jgi:RNA polymerase sigma-70 factor (ECF subfamily)
MPPPLDVEALLAQAGWIRSLARSLVADASRADDLVQRTFVAALEHPPEPSTPLRRWLGAVARNFARQDRRADARRASREASSARPEVVASARESVEAIAIQRELFEAVLALDEPYRTTIVQRFYEGLPPREIARRANLPVKTVKTRLARALEKLRASLDGRHGGVRGAWLPALLPLAAAPALPASALWSLLVNTKIKLALAVVAVAGVAAVVWNASTHPDSKVASAALASNPPVDLDPLKRDDAPLVPSSSTATREILPQAVEVKTRPPAPEHPVADGIARGRVLDVDGNAVGGVPLVLVPHAIGTPLDAYRSAEDAKQEPVATSAADGAFELRTKRERGTLIASSSQLTTVFAADLGAVQIHLQENLVVVVAPRGGIGGVVLTEEGEAVPQARVDVSVERRVISNLAGVADQSFEIPWRTTTDERGRFEILAAPAIEGAHVMTSAAGFSLDIRPVPLRPSLDLRIVLKRLDKTFPRGEVLDPRGHPVEGALVSCNLSSTKTDAEGRFTIDVGREYFDGLGPYPKDEIVAVGRGFLPARFAKPKEGWPAFVTLRLEGEPLEIRGRVVDESGSGVAGAEVWTVDEHEFGVVLEEVGNTGRHRSVEELLRGGDDRKVKTAKDGSFVLDGLLAERYRVGCLDRRTLQHAEIGSVAAGGQDVRLVLKGAERCVRVAGRIVSRGGKPVEGVEVNPGVRLPHWPYVDDPKFATHGDPVTTDAEGRFEFEKLSPEGLSFQLLSPQLLVMEWTPPADAKLGALEITVALRCHVQVDLGDRKDFADSFVVLDGAGSKLEAIEYQGPIAMVDDPVQIELGRSAVVAVSEDARTVVLSKGEEEVGRIPIALAPGELKVVRP